MTEAEWQTFPPSQSLELPAEGRRAFDLDKMIEFLSDKASARKARLLAVASCRRVQRLLAHEHPQKRGTGIRSVEVAEKYADGEATIDELYYAHLDSEFCVGFVDGPNPFNYASCTHTSDLLLVPEFALSHWIVFNRERIAPGRDGLSWAEYHEYQRDNDAETRAQVDLYRDIFNPFFKAQLDPRWRTDAVVALARDMYADRDFGSMSDLADALEHAGCTDLDILGHCRGSGPHIRGCWVVDLILGKE